MTSQNSYKYIPVFISLFFIFLAITMVSFIFLAKRDYPGEVTQNAYEKGLKYNTILTKSEEQAQLGWESDLHFTKQNTATPTLTFTLQDKTGKSLDNANVSAWLIRKAYIGQDTELALAPQGNGVYAGALELLGHDKKSGKTYSRQGEWEIHISATRDGHNYQQVKTLMLP